MGQLNFLRERPEKQLIIKCGRPEVGVFLQASADDMVRPCLNGDFDQVLLTARGGDIVVAEDSRAVRTSGQ